MSLSSAGGHRRPIPAAKKDDSEDVAWALSTAEAMNARGDRAEALKWLRRAAEAASEEQADDRALELAKAAADLAQLVAPAPAPPLSRPTSIPPARPKTAPPPAANPAAARTRSGRRSRPDVAVARTPDEVTQQTLVGSPPKRRGRASKPSANEIASPEPAPAAHHALPSAAEVDTWPTQSMTGHVPDEKTRVGVPAYQASAKAATYAAADHETARPGIGLDTESVEPGGAARPGEIDSPLRPAQAVRVVVWRSSEGVHVAPAGTSVSAISLDAMLVALDPSADLATWLSGK